MADPETPVDPLVEWDRLNKENHENLAASKMFVAMLSHLPSEIGNFTSWFTAGVGAVVVLLLANVDKVAPYLGGVVYARALTAFSVAVVLGAMSRFFATFVSALVAMQEELNVEMQATLAAFDTDAEKIRDIAMQRNVDLNADFDLAGLMEKFQAQLGPVVRLLVGRSLARTMQSGNPILHRFRALTRLAQVAAFLFLLSMMASLIGVAAVAGTISRNAWGAGTGTMPAIPTKVSEAPVSDATSSRAKASKPSLVPPKDK